MEKTVGLIELILIAVGLYIAAVVYALIAQHKEREQMRQAIADLPDFRCAYSRIGSDASDGIAIDEGNATICFLKRVPGSIATYRVHAADVVAVDVFENGITQTVQSGSGAIVMVGRFGVPVGRPRQTTHHKVTRIEVRITTNYPACPLHTLTILDSACTQGDAVHVSSNRNADEWRARILAMAARAQRTA